MASDFDEPSIRPEQGVPERRLYRIFERAESLLLSLIAMALILLAVLALFDTGRRVALQLMSERAQYSNAVSEGVDAAFLVIILLELLHTTLSQGPISQNLQEFLTIGVTASIRYGLSLTAEKTQPRDTVVNLMASAATVLVLVVALWLVRHQFGVLLNPDKAAPWRKPATDAERPKSHNVDRRASRRTQ